MKIVIVGPGALGCLFASFLWRTKNEIWLLDRRKERSLLLAKNGIRIEGISGNWQAAPRVAYKAEQVGKAAVVIICVKSYDTKQAAHSCLPLLDEDSAVLTLQNGIGNLEIISEIVGSEKVIAGVTNHGATLVDTGKIRHAGKGETFIGRLDSKISVRLRRIREVFNHASVQTRISRDIKGLLWSKLIINTGINALSAITRLKNGRLIEFEGTRQVLREAVLEAVKVAKRKRIKLIYDDPLAKVEAVCEATASNISSMLQDVLKKKRTEIDFINAAIVRQAKELGISTPVNAMLVNLVKVIEASYQSQVSIH
jgi:2-dehydropantoate 2-reductase